MNIVDQHLRGIAEPFQYSTPLISHHKFKYLPILMYTIGDYIIYMLQLINY